MHAQVKISQSHATGFAVPANLVAFPLNPKSGQRLTIEEEQAYGYGTLTLSHDMIQTMACDLPTIRQLLSDMEEAFTADGKVEKAVALIKVKHLWVRPSSLPADEYAALAVKKIAAVKKHLTSVERINAISVDLFYAGALKRLRDALSEIIPYDLVLTKAVTAFKQRCSLISQACRDLAQYAAAEMYLPRPTAQAIAEFCWLDQRLSYAYLDGNRYLASIMPTAAKREFRCQIAKRQKHIAEAARGLNVPMDELLVSWTSFSRMNNKLTRMNNSFAAFNTGLTEKIAREYGFTEDHDQVRSAAYQGLSRAMSLYAPERCLKFSTYAVNWIKQTIIRGLIQQELIRLPEGSHKMLVRVRAVYADMRNASDEYVCKAAGISGFELDGLRPYLKGNGAVSMDSVIGCENEEMGLHEFVADENNDFATELEEADEAAYLLALVKKSLPERELYILLHRTGLGGAEIKQLAELAGELNMSCQNVSRIEKKAQGSLAALPEFKQLWASYNCVSAVGD